MTGLNILFLTILLTLNVTNGQLDTTTKTQMRLGIKDAQEVLNYGKELKALEKLKPLANVLGIFGAFFTFAMLFVPSKESEEMRYMKTQFAQINMKLDRISSQIDSLKDLIKYETQKAAYVKSAHRIMFGYKQLQEFQDEITAHSPCSTKQACNRERVRIAERYIQSFNIKEDLYEIMTGTSGPGTVFGGPLLELANEYYKCDINKVFDFANSVVNLAFKGQYVVLAYEKLTGSNHSIATATKDWSEMAYNIRQKADDIKLKCYRNITKYIKTDVEDTNYQTGFKDNEKAAVALKNDLDKKYPWVLWTVLSYTASGAENHWGYESFINMPPEGRKRVLRVVGSDNGTYSTGLSMANKIEQTLQAQYKFDDSDDVFNAKSLYLKFNKHILATSVDFNKVLSFVVIRGDYKDLKVATNTSLFKLNKVFSVMRYQHDKYFRIWAMFKSDEQIAGAHCDMSCLPPNTCEWIPYISRTYCRCSKFFYGEHCQHYDTITLAANLDRMLTTTAHIPTVADAYFKIEDMQTYIGVSFDKVQQSMEHLTKMLQDKLTTELQWADLLTDYSNSIDELTYYIERFQALNSSDSRYESQRKTLAKYIVQPNNIEKWLYDLNFMIVGRRDVLEHKPMMFYQMQRYKKEACSKNYKEILDITWQKLMSLQTSGYMMWAIARAILYQSSDDITSIHTQKVSSQTKFMANKTCGLSISNSVIGNCSGGYYMYPGMTIENQCDENYYLVGNTTVTCDKPSSCHACDCYPQGASSQECEDQTGKCKCIGKFYGDKCSNSDCVWGSWSNWSECGEMGCSDKYKSKTITRRRTKVGQHHGHGKYCHETWLFVDDNTEEQVEHCFTNEFFYRNCFSKL